MLELMNVSHKMYKLEFIKALYWVKLKSNFRYCPIEVLEFYCRKINKPDLIKNYSGVRG